MELAEYNIEKLSLEKKSMRRDFFFKMGLLLCAVVFVLSSQTNLFRNFYIFKASKYEVECMAEFCMVYNPNNGKAKILQGSKKDYKLMSLTKDF